MACRSTAQKPLSDSAVVQHRGSPPSSPIRSRQVAPRCALRGSAAIANAKVIPAASSHASRRCSFPRCYCMASASLCLTSSDYGGTPTLAKSEIRIVLDRSIDVLKLKCGAIYKRTTSHKFALEYSRGVVIDCQKCGLPLESRLAPQLPNEFFQCVVSRCEASPQPQQCPTCRVSRFLGWAFRQKGSVSHSAPVQVISVPPDCFGVLASAGFTTPDCAIAIVRRHKHRRRVSRVIVFGPHVMDQAIARDEIRALKELCAFASNAYLAAESYRCGRAIPINLEKRLKRLTKANMSA